MFLMILLSGGFTASGLSGECSRVAPKGMFFSTGSEDIPNILNIILREKLLIRDLEKFILPNFVVRD